MRLRTEEDFIIEGVKDEDELKKKLKSHWWRLTHLYFIIDERAKRIRFVPNFFQRILLKGLHWRNLISKAAARHLDID